MMHIAPFEAEGELISHSLADQRGAGGERLFDDGSRARRRFLLRQPVRIAAASAAAVDIDQILDGKGQTVEDAARRGLAPAHSVRNEGAEIVGRCCRSRCHAHVSGPPPTPAI